ncbi:MAG TPA: ATP-binding protein [Gammaproteobacteria bacterium]|jgi:two-component system, NtrC family, nitrogen regulation sensor histidine kinase NtrY
MAVARRIRSALLTLLAVLGGLLWLIALLSFTRVTENSDDFAQRQYWILLINTVGITVLLALIVSNLWQLVRDYRRHVPGSRLRARMITVLVMVAITPLVGVYIFSVEFINRGIDNWLNVDVERGVTDALDLAKAALDIQTRERQEEVQRFARELADVDATDLARKVSSLRGSSQALDITVYGNNRVLAVASADVLTDAPLYPNDEVLLQLRQHGQYVSAEPQPNGAYRILAAAAIRSAATNEDIGFVQATFPTEQRLSTLMNAVQGVYTNVNELTFLRNALKTSFTLTLSLVLLISLLASVYGAFYFSRRLVTPIQLLMQGTRAVARGDFATRVPTPARDEIGFLVHSFNDMTQRLARASEDARQSQQQVERERRKLEVILARLSTGVVSLEPDLRIRTANHAASSILGVNLETHVGESIVQLAEKEPLLGQFVGVASARLQHGDREWREQIMLRAEGGRRVLMCACTELPGDTDSPNGYAIVFDDITALLQAQRDAAWGEVARRLAHEIKNPLTPIQLSAERLRRKYLKPEGGEAELLDRATHTIIQQVEAMKQMVNAFSEYARTPRMEVSRFDVNALIRELCDLYAHQEKPLAIKLALANDLPQIEADAGRLRQVLHNLLRNSLEAMEHQEEARVDISTRRVAGPDTDFVEIKVADNGPGFLRDIVHQAFEPYVTSKPKGTGLGLAIVKKLIEEHGGEIRARNREQGGAEISILIPMSVDAGGQSLLRRHDHRRERA